MIQIVLDDSQCRDLVCLNDYLDSDLSSMGSDQLWRNFFQLRSKLEKEFIYSAVVHYDSSAENLPELFSVLEDLFASSLIHLKLCRNGNKSDVTPD